MSFSDCNGFSKTSFRMKYDFGFTASSSQSKKQIHLDINQSDYVPKRFGLKYDPPTIKKLKKRLSKETAEETRSSPSNSIGRASCILTNQQSSTFSTSSHQVSEKENDWRSSSNFQHFNPQNYKDTFKTLAPISTNIASTPVENSIKNFWNKDDTEASVSTAESIRNPKEQSFSGGQGFWDIDDDCDRDVDYSKLNLNKLSVEELTKHKKKMDELFIKHQKKPGDPNFVYDVREEFNPQGINEWDDEL